MASSSTAPSAADKHMSKTTSWIAVGVLIVGFVLLGFALPMQSMVLGIIGGVILVVGVVLSFVWQLMEDFH